MQNDDDQGFDTIWDQILMEQVRCLRKNVLEGLYKNELQGPEQLHTVFSLYNRELNRDRVTLSYQKLGRMVLRHCGDQVAFQENGPMCVDSSCHPVPRLNGIFACTVRSQLIMKFLESNFLTKVATWEKGRKRATKGEK